MKMEQEKNNFTTNDIQTANNRTNCWAKESEMQFCSESNSARKKCITRKRNPEKAVKFVIRSLFVVKKIVF